MSKILFMLVAITANGEEYVQYRNMPLEHCVGRLMQERQAAGEVAAKVPKFSIRFQCRRQA